MVFRVSYALLGSRFVTLECKDGLHGFNDPATSLQAGFPKDSILGYSK